MDLLAHDPDHDWLTQYRIHRPRLATTVYAAPAPEIPEEEPTQPERRPLPAEPGLGIESGDLASLISEAFSELPDDRDRRVLSQRLGLVGDSSTLDKIGQDPELTRERVRQIQERALARLARLASCQGSPGDMLATFLSSHTAALTDYEEAQRLLELVEKHISAEPQLAIRVLLRSTGNSRERAESICRAASTVLRERRIHAKEHSKREDARARAESRVTKWLSDAQWPDQIACPPRQDRLRMQREVNEREHAGTFHSTKLGRDVSYESSLEELIYHQLELSTHIAYYQEQPVAITYTYRGSRYRYYPDLFVVTSDGRGMFVEVKPHWQIALSRNRAKADAARSFAHQRGFGWVSVSSYGTCHDLRCHHVDPTVWHGLDAALKEHPTTGLHPANR